MGGGWPTACLVLAVLTSAVVSDVKETERWSRQATAERRQGDWVPLTCAHCRPVDQGSQGSDSLSSVLTPPPRAEGARLLPPPPPGPDGLLQLAATGFPQAYTQQRKPHQQYLQETSQSINRPQAQFLKAPPPGNSFVHEPSTDFQPPQQPQEFSNQQNRQPHVLSFNQQSVPQPYLNQPLLIGPQFFAAPFFPQPSIPQNIQPISPVSIQPLNPIAPNIVPDTKQNFQIPADRPEFIQQITASTPGATIPPQQVITQAAAPQLQYTANDTDSQRDEEEKEVQLLYVPVETLNQRGRNIAKQKFLPNNQQDVALQQVVGAEHNKFTSSSTKEYEFTTRTPHFEDQANFNTDSHAAKQHGKHVQFQQQQLPDDQEQFNSQTHAVRQQFVKQQQAQFQQQAPFENTQQFKVDSNTKQQYNFKQNDQFQQQFQQNQDQFEGHANIQENNQFSQVRPEILQNFPAQNVNQFGQLNEQHRQTIQQGQEHRQTIQQGQEHRQITQQGQEHQQTIQQGRERPQTIQQGHDHRHTIQQGQEHQQTIQQGQERPQTIQQGQDHRHTIQQGQEHQQTIQQGQERPQTIPQGQDHRQTLQQGKEHFRTPENTANQQLTTQQNFQQPLTQIQHELFNQQGQFVQQEFNANLNSQFNQAPVNQPSVLPQHKEQHYINQQIRFDHQLSQQQAQIQHQGTTQQPEASLETEKPTSQTRAPDVYTTQQNTRQRIREPQQSNRNVQPQISELQQIPQHYQQQRVNNANLSPVGQAHNVRQNQQSWSNQELSNAQLSGQQDVSPQQTFETQQAQEFFSSPQPVSNLPLSSTILPPQTTPIPNQPPLSVYMETTEDTKVNDVLRLLKNAKTIQVLDTVGMDSPQVFVGPSNLRAPNGYIKFELPYLNTLESNRVERKVDKLPFFVAPLNFNPPPGYSKIPFPAPHIGSVVVSNITILKNALHEKQFENMHSIVQSSSERYLNQFTLPAEIPPISPQLPSLVNSLQDEVYDGSTTAFTPTTESTTIVYTTPSYRGRGTSRGSHRGSSNYPTSASPTRRSQTRTRRPYDGRPYSRRQPVTTPSTTIEPSTEATTVQQFTPHPENVPFNSEAQLTYRTASPLNEQEGNTQPIHSGTYQDDQIVANNFNQGQFISEQQAAQQFVNENIQQTDGFNTQQAEQYHQNEQQHQNSYTPVEAAAHPTVIPPTASADVQEEQTFKSQRTNGLRRDPSRQQQRFRGRQRLTTTTTTEVYQEPIQPVAQHFNEQVSSGQNYQNIPRRPHLRNQNQNRLVEKTHFRAPVTENDFNIQQTERADIGVQTTERLLTTQTDEHFNNQNNQFSQQSNFQSVPQNQQAVPQFQQYHQPQVQFSKPSTDQTNFNISSLQGTFDQVHDPQNSHSQFALNQFQQVGFQRELDLQQQQQQHNQQQQANNQDVNFHQTTPASEDYKTFQQNFFDQSGQQQQQEQQQQQKQDNIQDVNIHQTRPANGDFNTFQQNVFDQSGQQQAVSPQDHQAHFQQNIDQTSQLGQVQGQVQQNYFSPQKQEEELVFQGEGQAQFVQGSQGQQISTLNQFDNGAGVTSSIPQEHLVQTQETESSPSHTEQTTQVQHNQNRLTKYSRPHGRLPVATDLTNEERTHSPRRGQSHFQVNSEGSDASAVDEATTKASLVRVRGRVRSRLRGSTKNYQSTTTEAPNYPTTFFNRQKTNQEKEESQEYVPRKRINYNTRQPTTYSRNTIKDLTTEQNTPDFNDATERQSTTAGFVDYIDITTTTTTEEPTTKSARKYQHILNRNKIRRVRPTNSPTISGSSGTTKFLLPTTPPPVTRLPGTTRARIRKPQAKSTTTEYPQINPSWNEKENFAPSAGSNEILEPLYQTKDKVQPSFGFQRGPDIPIKTTPKPLPVSGDDDAYWNQGFTIQQSTSFDFKPDASSVTPASFPDDGKFQGSFSPIWDGQIELQDGNYYDLVNQKQIVRDDNDQTPFSSDNQKVIYKDIKNRLQVGKENQYTEKTHEVKTPVQANDEDDTQGDRVYPVYREVVRPSESVHEETSQEYADNYENDQKSLHEKDEHIKGLPREEKGNEGEETEAKGGPLKRKIFATVPGKKGGRRRGSWVRVRVHKTQDMFETAESQNLASLSENAIKGVGKNVGEKGVWAAEPNTEPPQTTTTTTATAATESNSDPGETINFEDALKDMLKEFITNPEEDEESKEDVITEANTTSPDLSETKNNSFPLQTDEQKEGNENEETQRFQTEVSSLKAVVVEEDSLKTDSEPVKTVVPDVVTSDVFTQEPTTIFQTAENLETTIDPEITTTPNEEPYKNQHSSRILGTSTTTEISLETEICYRGRCVKTKKADKPESDSDLLPME